MLSFRAQSFELIILAMRARKSGMGAEWAGEQISLNVVFEKERDFPISVKVTVHLTEERQIFLSEIIWRLKEQSLNDYFDSSVSFYHEARKLYIFGFTVPNDLQEHEIATQEKFKKRIPEGALSHSNQQPCLRLRFRKTIPGRVANLKEEQRSKYFEDQGERTKQKEKTIAEVIEKVALWRKLYTGFVNEKGEFVHMDLDSSANEIGIVKKTLDDYLLQIRNGKRYGFNFHKRRLDKIGELRSFVKEHKQMEGRAGPKRE